MLQLLQAFATALLAAQGAAQALAAAQLHAQQLLVQSMLEHHDGHALAQAHAQGIEALVPAYAHMTALWAMQAAVEDAAPPVVLAGMHAQGQAFGPLFEQGDVLLHQLAVAVGDVAAAGMEGDDDEGSSDGAGGGDGAGEGSGDESDGEMGSVAGEGDGDGGDDQLVIDLTMDSNSDSDVE